MAGEASSPLWNASSVAELDLEKGKRPALHSFTQPASPLAGGSHPTALILIAITPGFS